MIRVVELYGGWAVSERLRGRDRYLKLFSRTALGKKKAQEYARKLRSGETPIPASQTWNEFVRSQRRRHRKNPMLSKNAKLVLGVAGAAAVLGLGYYYLFPAKTQLTAGSFAVTQGTNYSFRTQSTLNQSDLQAALGALGFTNMQMLPSPADTPRGQGNIDVAGTYTGQTGNLAAQQNGFAFINMIAV